MNNLIERYLYDVVRRLPEKNQDEVKKELRSNIDDMLPNNPTEQQVVDVLKTLGNPRILASNYLGKPKSLIAPEWMDDYLRVLKVVLIVFGCLSMVFGLIEHITHPEATELVELVFEVIGHVLSDAIQRLFSGFALVTLIFALISNYESKVKLKEWNPKNLPEVPKEQAVTIKKSHSVLGLIVTVIFGTIFIFLLINNQVYLAWYVEDGGWVLDSVMFNNATVKMFIPFFVITIIVSIASYLVKIYIGHWNGLVAGIYTFDQVFSAMVGLLFLNHEQLLSTDFIAGVAELLSLTTGKMQEIFNGAAIGISVLIAFGIIADLVTTWLKAIKAKA